MDDTRAEQFTGRVLADTAAAATVVMAALGDRLGLFKQLAHGPATSGELAGRAGLSERYVREWLGGMHAAGYLEFDPAQDRFGLPAEHVPTLASEPGPAFFGGVHQELIGAIQRYDQVAAAFRDGGGVAPADLHPDVWAGTSRFTAQWHQNMLVQQWLPLVPDTTAKLSAGARVADVGCGTGQALIALARAFPAVTGTGYDAHPPVIEQARQAAADAGVADRVTYQVRDAATGLPEAFDVITTFDVVHDSADPLRPAAIDPGRAAARRQVPVPGNQLRRSASSQRRPHRLPAVRVLPPVLHDHVAGPGRRRAGHPRAARIGTAPAGRRPVLPRSAASRWTTRSTRSTSWRGKDRPCVTACPMRDRSCRVPTGRALRHGPSGPQI